MALFPGDLDQWKDADLLERWAKLVEVRDQVNLQLEEKRKDKTITGNLSARVLLTPDSETVPLLEQYREFLPTLFGVSEVSLKTLGPQDLKTSGGPRVTVEKAAGVKCERCWRYVPSLNDKGLCPRCDDALAQPVSL